MLRRGPAPAAEGKPHRWHVIAAVPFIALPHGALGRWKMASVTGSGSQFELTPLGDLEEIAAVGGGYEVASATPSSLAAAGCRFGSARSMVSVLISIGDCTQVSSPQPCSQPGQISSSAR